MLRVLSVLSLLLAAGAPALAKDECPGFGGDKAFDALIRQLSAEKSCKAAAAKLDDCRWGSSADTTFGPIVVKTCEDAFYARLTPSQQLNYAKRMQMCAYRYAKQSGTLYMSEAALCQVGVASRIAENQKEADSPVKASFDCGKAHTPMEVAICSNDDLGQADIILAEAYKTWLGLAPDAKAARAADERRWLTDIAGTCHLDARSAGSKPVDRCLAHAFVLRFTALDACMEGDLNLDCLHSETARLGAEDASRASFDCQAPTTPLEIVICADADLGQTDIKLAQAYHAADDVMGGGQHKLLVDSERKWLRFTTTACPLGAVGGIPPLAARTCVRSAFETRIAQLDTCAKAAAPDRPACLDAFAISPKK